MIKELFLREREWREKVKKILIILTILITGLIAQTPGVVHITFDNGVVTTSADDTFYEFDIKAYITGTTNSNDLKLGNFTLYIKYDTELFGNLIVDSGSLTYKTDVSSETDLLETLVSGFFPAYSVSEAVDNKENIFALSVQANFSEPDNYPPVSNNFENPTHGIF